jgi:6-phosphogluconate dehydrogenase
MMDASNEHWKSTERRQKSLDPDEIHYVGMGVSGGYQSARHGPSILPGGSPEALHQVMPFLEKVAAKDKQGRPCVKKLGPGGCGHYVKMMHNGIEQGMMSTLCEVWFIMNKCLGMEYEQIGKTFAEWNKSGPLVSIHTFSFVHFAG